MIYTFYSFKGGVGRSMALANIAEHFYRRGLKVLIVDFDLEAPGLENFFREAVPADEVAERRGVVDMLLSYKELYALPRSQAAAAAESSATATPFAFPIEALTNFVVPIYEENRHGGALFLIPAGRRAGDELTRYGERINFDWDDFYLNWSGEQFLEWFRLEAETLADVVLIDSRTGMTELSGVCTFHLADVVVMLVAPSGQNLNGTKIIARSLSDERLVVEGRKGRPLRLLPVPSRLERSEAKLLDDFGDEFRASLVPFIAPQLKFENDPFIDLRIPYVPYYAYMENVAVREPERSVAADLIAAYTALATVLIELAPRDSRLYKAYYTFGSKRTQQEGAGTPDVPLDAPFMGREWVFERLEEWLANPGPRAFLITGEPGSGKTTLSRRLVQMSLGKAPDAGHPRLGLGAVSASYFCAALDPRGHDPRRFVESVASQLAARHPPYASALLHSNVDASIEVTQSISATERGAEITGVNINQVNVHDAPVRSSFEQVLTRPLEQLYREGFDETILILIDALDATRANEGEQSLIELLCLVTSGRLALPEQVRFIITSRHDVQILRAIEGGRLDLTEDAPSAFEEILDFVSSLLNVLAEPEREAVAHSIAKMSEGNFLYARLVADDLRLGAGRPEGSLPPTLSRSVHEFYHEMMKREVDTGSERWTKRDRPFLGALAVAPEALDSKQLAGATERSLSETGDILRTWAAYIEGPHPDGPFKLYHASFRDFLLADEEYNVYPAEAHQALADSCISEYEDNWLDSDDYALKYTPTHLLSAVRLTSQRRARQALMENCERVLTAYGFIEAKVTRIGVDQLLNDLRGALSLSQELPSYQALENLLRLFEAEATNLRNRDKLLRPGVFAEIVQKRALKLGLLDVSIKAGERLEQLRAEGAAKLPSRGAGTKKTGFGLEVFEAGAGNAMLLHYGTPEDPGLIVVDGGPAPTYAKALRPRLQSLQRAPGRGESLPIELLIASQPDEGHAAGLLALTNELLEKHEAAQPFPYKIKGLWHNDLGHLIAPELISALQQKFSEGTNGDKMIADAIHIGRQLSGAAERLALPVNAPFEGVILAERSRRSSVAVGKGLRLTVLGPTRKRLMKFQDSWEDYLELRSKRQPIDLSNYPGDLDHRLPSIILLAEANGLRMLLPSYAWADEILDGLRTTKLLKSGKLHLNLLMLPNHGSPYSLSTELLQSVTADNYVISNSSEGSVSPYFINETLSMLSRARGRDRYTIHLTNRNSVLDAFLAQEMERGINYRVVVREADAPSIRVNLEGQSPSH